MRSFLSQSILLGFAATSTAIYRGDITTSRANAIGAVRVQSGSDQDNFGSGVVLGNGRCVITAAHVVQGKSPADLKVFRNREDEGTIVRTDTCVKGSSIHVHPLYMGTSNPEEDPSAYDFAVVEVDSTMNASPWKVSQSRGGYQDINLYGWGSIPKSPATYPPDLRSAVNKNRALDYWSQCRRWKDIVGAICMMNQESSPPNNAPPEGLNCGGDSGGPAVIQEYVVGVASAINGICGYQSAGLLAAMSGSNQERFLQQHASTCGFTFGSPTEIEVIGDL
ncbi:trypsin-like cysteine/serine peptidase domain-containing protein [Hypomontagnella submonticulosa]|nr:trypsin-like cysteine/serine peptidase domain-containing protein [Hypomontagnella submonticulosa]